MNGLGGRIMAGLRDIIEPAANPLTLENLQQLSINLQKHVEQNKDHLSTYPDPEPLCIRWNLWPFIN